MEQAICAEVIHAGQTSSMVISSMKGMTNGRFPARGAPIKVLRQMGAGRRLIEAGCSSFDV